MEKTKMTRRRFLSLSGAGLAGTVILGAVSCGGGGSGSGSGGGPTSVTMATEPWIGYGPWYVAREKGFDKKNGVNLDIKQFTQDQDLNAAFASRKAMVANVATHTSIKFQAAGLDFTTVLVEDESKAADAIIAPKSVRSVRDLQGKTVAYEQGTTSDLLLHYALQQNGVSGDSIKSVFIPAADVGNALLAGRVNIGVTYEPYLSTALAKDSNLKLLYTAGEKPGLISDVLVVQKDMINSQADVVKNLLRTWNEAVSFYDQNASEAQAIIGKNVGVNNPKQLKTTFAGVELFSLKENQQLLGGPFQATMESIEKILKVQGQIKQSVNPTATLDKQFVEELAK